MNYKIYQTPLVERYASQEMSFIFSPDFRFKTWRKLWITLAKVQKELGLSISQSQIDELLAHASKINYEDAQKYEKITKHEVMSHIHAFALQCPQAKKIIHLGATSAFVLDNTDLIQMKKALLLIKKQLVNLIKDLKDFALKYKNLATLGFTHYQPAQPTTVGKRASLWIQDLIYDYHELNYKLENMPFRGVKGTTGTQNSFLKLFDGDNDKVKQLDIRVTKKMGFDKRALVTGQTYSRKIDFGILALLSAIAQSAHKFSNDIRLLQNLGELEEPFDEKQVGSSAMAYKKNPMRAERIASLARYVINMSQNGAFTQAAQWLERTLDDSANKRLSIPESFLGVNAILSLYQNVIRGLKVYNKVIEKNLNNEIPFMITEDIIMECVKRGADRQEIHEIIRQLSIASAKNIKELGKENTLLKLLSEHAKIPFSLNELQKMTKNIHLTGLSQNQVEDLINEEVNDILKNEQSQLTKDLTEIEV